MRSPWALRHRILVAIRFRTCCPVQRFQNTLPSRRVARRVSLLAVAAGQSFFPWTPALADRDDRAGLPVDDGGVAAAGVNGAGCARLMRIENSPPTIACPTPTSVPPGATVHLGPVEICGLSHPRRGGHSLPPPAGPHRERGHRAPPARCAQPGRCDVGRHEFTGATAPPRAPWSLGVFAIRRFNTPDDFNRSETDRQMQAEAQTNRKSVQGLGRSSGAIRSVA